MSTDRRTSTIPPDTLRLVFSRLREKVLRRTDEDRHAQRRAIDALRSRIKRLDPPISSNDSYEQVRPRLEKLDEFHALESDELRQQAFDKVVRRLKDREEEDRDRRSRDSPRRSEHRDRDRDRDRDRERERDRDRDSHRSDSHRSRHRSRTPEQDAYAADRRKAQADRERQYRKGSSFGLSPPPSATARREDKTDRYVPSDHRDHRARSPRDRGDRYDGRSSGRPSSGGGGSAYLSRADPREAATAAELDYGDLSASRNATTRRRRDDSEDAEAANGREATRLRSSRDRSEETAKEKDDVAYKSGSEEGEIEEE
jgi:pre-mRNA-processing factor 40